jgi:TonB family protein
MHRLLLLFALVVSGMSGTDLSGTWTGTLEHQGENQGICIYVAQDGKQLKGQIAYRHDTKVASVEGVFAGEAVDLVISDGAAADGTIRLTGSDRSLAGSATLDGKSESITLKKYEVPSQFYRFGKGRKEPVPLRASQPKYTQKARDARVQGNVALSVPIESSGVAGPDITVLSGLGLGLDEEAIKCVRTWLFSPPDYQCNPKPLNRRIVIQFRLLD